MARREGEVAQEVVDTPGYLRDWAFNRVKRSNDDGPGGLGDGHARSGRAPLRSEEDPYALPDALQGVPPDGRPGHP